MSTMFTDVNEKTSEIAAQVGRTPQNWNSSVFSMIQNLSESVVVPIAGIIITLVLCYELISMLTERNNLHDVDAQPGDLIFFEKTYNTVGASHVGIYVGNGMMIHCGDPISYTSINSTYWQNHFLGFGRIK